MLGEKQCGVNKAEVWFRETLCTDKSIKELFRCVDPFADLPQQNTCLDKIIPSLLSKRIITISFLLQNFIWNVPTQHLLHGRCPQIMCTDHILVSLHQPDDGLIESVKSAIILLQPN